MKDVWLAILGITIIATAYYSEELRFYIKAPKTQPPPKSVPTPVFFSEIQPNYLQYFAPSAVATPTPIPTVPPGSQYIDASDLSLNDFDPTRENDPRHMGGGVVKVRPNEYENVDFDLAGCNKERVVMRVDTQEQVKYCINFSGNYYCGDQMSQLYDVTDTVGRGVRESSIHLLTETSDIVRLYVHFYCL